MTTQAWDAALYDGKHAFVAQYGKALLDLLAARPGERILDLGSGTGDLARKIADAGATVVGLDNSPDMVAAARAKHPDLEFVAGDATSFAFEWSFDAVFSNAVLHWVRPPEAAARCVARALKPGGRFVAEFGGQGNIASIAAAARDALRQVTGVDAPNPLYFPSVGEYAAVLEGAGLEVQAAWLFDRPTPLEGEDGMRDWFRMFGGGVLGAAMLRGAAADDIARATAIAERTLRKTNYQDGRWFADYRRIRILAIQP